MSCRSRRLARERVLGWLGCGAKPASWSTRQKGLRSLRAQDREGGRRRPRDNGGTTDRRRGRKKGGAGPQVRAGICRLGKDTGGDISEDSTGGIHQGGAGCGISKHIL